MSLAAILAGLQAAIAASPGPAFVLTVRTSAARGLGSALLLALGLALAILLWAASALAGLSLLFDLAPWLNTALRVAGGIFLIWIGVGLWRGARTPPPRPDPTQSAPRGGGLALVRLGLLTNLGNPKALAYFAAVFSGLLPANPSIATMALFLAVVFVVEFGWYALVSRVFSAAPARRVYGRIKTSAERLFGALICGLGLRIATTP